MTKAQIWADKVTIFSGSWPFVFWFGGISVLWIAVNLFHKTTFDPYPFLFLNWILTVVSTFTNPLIMMSNNRQNDNDRERMEEINKKLDELLKWKREVSPLSNPVQED